MSAYAFINISAKILFACGASPVQGGKINKGNYYNQLSYRYSVSCVLSKNIRMFIHHGQQYYKKKCYSYSKYLAPLADQEFIHNYVFILCFHACYYNIPGESFVDRYGFKLNLK